MVGKVYRHDKVRDLDAWYTAFNIQPGENSTWALRSGGQRVERVAACGLPCGKVYLTGPIFFMFQREA